MENAIKAVAFIAVRGTSGNIGNGINVRPMCVVIKKLICAMANSRSLKTVFDSQ
jgi:hypothetical protein